MSISNDIKVGITQAIEQEKINNIAKDLCKGYTNCTCNERDGHCSMPQRDAKIIYEAGYRKETETITEIQKRIKDVLNNPATSKINVRTAVGMEMMVTKILNDYLKEIKSREKGN